MSSPHGSHKSDIPTYQDAIEPVQNHPFEVSVKPKTDGGRSGPASPAFTGNSHEHGRPELIGSPTLGQQREYTIEQEKRSPLSFVVGKGKGWFQYMKTKEFWIVLVLGWVVKCNIREKQRLIET